MSNLSNLDGVVNSVFSIGVGPRKLTMEVGRGMVTVNKGLDTGANPIRSQALPENWDDLVNLRAVQKMMDDIVATIMNPEPVSIDMSAIESYPAIIKLGSYDIGHYLDRIVFTVDTTSEDVKMSIGTMDEPEKLFPATNLKTLNQICTDKELNILLTAEEDYFIFLDKDISVIPPEEFVQKVYNVHPNVSSKITTDASGNVVTIALSGAGVEPLISYPEMFGAVTGNYVDFGINMNLPKGTYRITQQNACLSLYADDPTVSQDENGVWTKSKEYVIEEDPADDEFIYTFLMGNKTDNAWTHITVTDAEDNPVVVYHIQNQMIFANEIAEMATPKKGEITHTTDLEVTDTIEDDIHNVVVTATAAKNINEDATGRKECQILIPYAPTGDFVYSITSPALDMVEPDEDGIRTLTSEIAMPDTLDENGQIYMPIILTEDKSSYPIVVTFIDKATNATVMYVIDNRVTFESDPGTDLDVPEDPPTGDSGNDPETPTVTESGAIFVRLISY